MYKWRGASRRRAPPYGNPNRQSPERLPAGERQRSCPRRRVTPAPLVHGGVTAAPFENAPDRGHSRRGYWAQLCLLHYRRHAHSAPAALSQPRCPRRRRVAQEVCSCAVRERTGGRGNHGGNAPARLSAGSRLRCGSRAMMTIKNVLHRQFDGRGAGNPLTANRQRAMVRMTTLAL